ncbi:Chaperone protein dnaJ 11 [Hirschfeldia incana]|nr:Chaperone protein dnaJ 11 [Hirschfeldia incana]
MLSSSPTSFAHPFLSSSPPLSPISPPSLATRLPPPLVSASCSYTYTDDPPRLHQTPRRLTTPATASLYEVLDVPRGATSQDIKSAYRRLARICHPDVAGTDRSNSSSADEFMKIHAAYCTLSDPEKRSVYDRRMLRRSRPLTVSTSGMGSYVGRNWETDQCW